MLLDEKGKIMSSEPEQDARVQELADVIIPRIAGAMRGAAEELRRQDSPMQGWGTALREAKSPAELDRVSRELGMSLRESEVGAAFLARVEAVDRIVDSVVEEWGSQREMPAEEVRQIADQALRVVATKMYQMFGVEIPPRREKAGKLTKTKRPDSIGEVAPSGIRAAITAHRTFSKLVILLFSRLRLGSSRLEGVADITHQRMGHDLRQRPNLQLGLDCSENAA